MHCRWPAAVRQVYDHTSVPSSPRAMRWQPRAYCPRFHAAIAPLPHVAVGPRFHACEVAMSKTICDGARLKHGARRCCTATTAARSSASHFSSLQRSPTMMGVVLVTFEDACGANRSLE